MYIINDSARHQYQDICPPIFQIFLKNFIKISSIIKECPEEILVKLEIVLKISKSGWNTVLWCDIKEGLLFFWQIVDLYYF